MPWKETDVLKERMKFIAASMEESWSMTELCTAFGISRKTGYKLIARYVEEGLDGLRDRPRAPKLHPNKTPSAIEALVVKARISHPNWGPRKLVPWLSRRHPSVTWPAPSTVGDILKRHGLVRPRKKRKRCTPATKPFAEALKPNDIWCTDFKGWFRTGDGQRCAPLTILDGYSRYLMGCRVVAKTDIEHVKKCFKAVFREYGLPKVIRSDNGSPFASCGLGGLTRLSVWWIKLGILPERIEPGKPQQNGRHERMHLTLKQETAMPPSSNMRCQQRAFDHFKTEYNHDRPHEALADKVPAELYAVSPREFPKAIETPEYPGHFETRSVRKNGDIKWKCKRVYLSESLARESVGLEQIDDRRWRILFGPVELALLDSPTWKILRYPRRRIST